MGKIPRNTTKFILSAFDGTFKLTVGKCVELVKFKIAFIREITMGR